MSLDIVAGPNPNSFQLTFSKEYLATTPQEVGRGTEKRREKVNSENVSGLRAMCFPHSGRGGDGDEEAEVTISTGGNLNVTTSRRRPWNSNRLVQVEHHFIGCILFQEVV